MSDENKDILMDEQIAGSKEAADVIEKTMDKFLDAASVDHVYSEPVKYGDTIVIPAAEVLSAAGFGLGFGSGSSGEEEEGEESSGSAGGGGGGGRVLARPVAVVVVSPEGVRIEPVADRTKVLLALITTLGFMFSILARIKNTGRG
jgi:uncharacterized spore protein YtfJ